MSRTLSMAFALWVSLTLTGTALSHHVEGGKGASMEIHAPYSRAMLPGAKVGGGYLKIINDGDDDRLVGAISDRAGTVEIHEMKMDRGIMEMRKLANGVAVPAHSTLELKPGGYHLMFMNVSQPFKEGEVINATLEFEKAGSIEVELTVGAAAGQVNLQHSHGDHRQ